jgi:hypothetical protein
VPLEHTNTMIDGFNALLWTSNSKLDHGGGLKELVVRLAKGTRNLLDQGSACTDTSGWQQVCTTPWGSSHLSGSRSKAIASVECRCGIVA